MSVRFSGRRDDQPRGSPGSVLLAVAVRFGINAVALWTAARLISGIEIEGWGSLLAAAAIFGVVNASIKPVSHILGCPLTCLTLGLFALVINAAMLALTGWVAGLFDLEVSIEWFWPALLGALLVSLVSAMLSAFVGRPLVREVGRSRRRHEDDSRPD